MGATEVKMKLLVDTKSQKVLFAEVGKECVDFLFHILSLPIGFVINILTKKEMVGSIANLYVSIENLNETYFQSHQTKEMLLQPKLPISSIPLLFLPHNVPTTTATRTFYTCPYNNFCSVSEAPNAHCPRCKSAMKGKVQCIDPPRGKMIYQSGSRSPDTYLYGGGARARKFYKCEYSCGTSVSECSNACCSSCDNIMTSTVSYISQPAANTSCSCEVGGIVKGVISYMVLDNLEVKPMSTISSLTLFNQFNIKDVCALQEKTVTLTVDKALKLLKLSLKSNTVLTDVFLS